MLAAGYATRMYPLTRERAKPLLPVGGKAILDHLVDRILGIREIRELAVVCNSRFLEAFREWEKARGFSVPVRIVDDGSTCNENRLGALGDLGLALEVLNAFNSRGPSLVVAGDNLFPFEFQPVVDFFRGKETDVITCYAQDDPARLRRTGVAVLADDGSVLEFEEKPAEPRSHWAVPPLYIYTAGTLQEVSRYLAEGNPPDAPGHLVRWLCHRKPVFAYRCPEGPHDVGTLESYRAVDRLYSDPPAGPA